jgi:hypothetical protein
MAKKKVKKQEQDSNSEEVAKIEVEDIEEDYKVDFEIRKEVESNEDKSYDCS